MSSTKVSVRSLQTQLDLKSSDAARLMAKISAAKNPRKVEEVMDLANSMLSGFGVESKSDSDAWAEFFLDTVMLYVNMGDQYNATLIYDVKAGEFVIDDYESWVRRNKR